MKEIYELRDWGKLMNFSKHNVYVLINVFVHLLVLNILKINKNN